MAPATSPELDAKQAELNSFRESRERPARKGPWVNVLLAALLFLLLSLPCAAKPKDLDSVWTEEAAVRVVVDYLRMTLQLSEDWVGWDLVYQDYWRVTDVRAPELPVLLF